MHLFHRIVRIIITKLIPIKTINTSYMCELKNNITQKKTLTIPSTNNCIGITTKSNIAFTTFKEKNKKKILFNLTKKKTTKTYH